MRRDQMLDKATVKLVKYTYVRRCPQWRYSQISDDWKGVRSSTIDDVEAV